MNCYYHPEEVAVASCVDCGKALCKTCAAKYEISICDDCNEKRNAGDTNLAIKQFIPVFILFIIGAVIGFVLSDNNGDLGSRTL